MTSPNLDAENEEKPLDPAVERVRRKLVRFMVVNLGLLFVALMAVIGALVYKTRNAPSSEPAVERTEIPSPEGKPVIEGEIPLPAGSRIVSQSLSGKRITLDVELQDRSRTIFLYDFSERRVIGQVRVTGQ